MSLYERVATTDDGQRRLASARLRYRVLGALHEGLERSGRSKAEISRALGIRKSAVGAVFSGDGNLRVNTIAEYLNAMGCELEVTVVPAGAPRAEARRAPVHLELVKGTAQRMGTLSSGGRMRPGTVRPVSVGDARPIAVSNA